MSFNGTLGRALAAGLLLGFASAASAQESAFLGFPGNYRIPPGLLEWSDPASRRGFSTTGHRLSFSAYGLGGSGLGTGYGSAAAARSPGGTGGYRSSPWLRSSGYNAGFAGSRWLGSSGYNAGFHASPWLGSTGYNAGVRGD